MGGHSAGEIASAAVVGRLAEHANADSVEPSAIENSLRLAVDDMRSSAGDIETGTGTTVTGIAITVANGAPAWLVFNIG
ncbi:MAG: serine/threonine-protein phosphatase, partial [Microterricola sp.]